jgi:acyl-CoA thioesterase-1
MPWIAYFVAGGATFLIGAALIALAAIARALVTRRSLTILTIAIAAVGIVFVAISAEAIPTWIYCIWTISTGTWLSRPMFANRRHRRWIDSSQLAITLVAIVPAASFRLPPQLSPASFSRLYVIGDSISAGIGHEQTWPAILGAEHHVEVIDLSRAGSTIADATRRLQSQPLADGLVVLEIGGNDVIGHSGAARFGSDLDRLVRQVSGTDRVVVMLELPLFPFDNSYGIQQRRIASRYGIRLIPRRYFVQVISSRGATTDGIHLSAAGQHRMAQMIWDMLGPSLRDGGEGGT